MDDAQPPKEVKEAPVDTAEEENKDRSRDGSRDRDRDRRRRRSRSRDRRRRRSRSRSRSRSRRRKKKHRSRRSDSRSRSPERKRKKKKGGWDVKPEDMPGGVAPANPMVHGMPAHPGMLGHNGARVDPKKARTAYVGGLNHAYGITADVLRRFFEEQLPRVTDRPKVHGRAVETVSMNSNGVYGFVEFYNSFDADIAMCMDGITLNGVQLQIRRPRNFTPDPNAKKYHIPGLVSSQVPDGPHKIFLGSLPLHLNDAEVQAIASSFGPLEAFSLVKERDSHLSKGYAFFSYVDKNLTNVVCQALNGKEIQGKTVACKVANPKVSIPQPGMGMMGGAMGMGAMGMGAMGMGAMGMGAMGMGAMGMGNPGAVLGLPGLLGSNVRPPTSYLRMLNMVTAEDLQDDAEYKDILEDVREECANYGEVQRVSIPRPPHPESGKIFLEYASVQQAVAAKNALSGRTFAERLISVEFIQENEMVA